MSRAVDMSQAVGDSGRKPAGTSGSATEGPAREAWRPTRRQSILGVVGVVVLVFALVNLNNVKVDWVLATWSTPLIVVIVLSLAVGFGLGYFVSRRRASSAAAKLDD